MYLVSILGAANKGSWGSPCRGHTRNTYANTYASNFVVACLRGLVCAPTGHSFKVGTGLLWYRWAYSSDGCKHVPPDRGKTYVYFRKLCKSILGTQVSCSCCLCNGGDAAAGFARGTTEFQANEPTICGGAEQLRFIIVCACT